MDIFSDTSEITPERWAFLKSGAFFSASLFLTLLVSIYLFFFQVQPALARGRVGVSPQSKEITINLSSVSTDDPRKSLDPGMDADVGRCTARQQGSQALTITIFNGYPGYSCTLHFTLTNQGDSPVVLQPVTITAPSALRISPLERPESITLTPDTSTDQAFQIVIQPSAQETTGYEFQIQQRVVLAEP